MRMRIFPDLVMELGPVDYLIMLLPILVFVAIVAAITVLLIVLLKKKKEGK